MRKCLAVLVAVAGAAAFAENYTWTGVGVQGSWKDAANWSGDGYPHLQGDTATVAVDADITVDESIVLTELNVKGGAKVTVRDNGTAELRFQPFTTATGSKVTGGPKVTEEGSELVLLAKVVNDKDTASGGYNRVDPKASDGGILRFGGSWANGTVTGVTYLGGKSGTLVFDGTQFAAGNIDVGFDSTGGNNARTETMVITNGAAITSTGTFTMGSNGGTPNTRVVQYPDTTFSVSQMGMGTSAKYNEGWCVTNVYEQKGGTLAITDTVNLGKRLSGFLLQSSGTTTCSQIRFEVEPAAYSRLDVTGGTFGFVKLHADLRSGTSVGDLTTTTLPNPRNVDISFANCTVLNRGAYHNFIAHPVKLDGDIVFDATSLRTIGFSNPVIGDDFNPTMTAGTPVDLTMTRDFTQTRGAPRYNTFTVASGCTYTLAGGTFEANDLVLADPSASFVLADGELVFSSNASPSGVFKVAGAAKVNVAAGKTVNLNVELGRGGEVIRTGAGTLNLVYCGNSFLTGGAYGFGTLAVGTADRTVLTIDGADVTADKLTFGSKSVAFTSGKIVLASGSLKFGAIAGDTVEPGEIELRGGTLKVDVNMNLSANVCVSGPATIDVASGKTFTFAALPTFADDATLVKTGAGTICFPDSSMTLWRGDFDIVEGIVQLKKAATLKHDPAAASPTHTVTVRDNGRFIIGERYHLAQVAAWVDYVIEDGGCVVGFERNTIPVNSITVDGVAQAVGVYSGTVFSGNAYEDVIGWFRQNGGAYNSALVVPYRWTGAGDGVSWESEANWANNEKPVVAVAEVTDKGTKEVITPAVYSFADLSAAEHVTFANALTITGLIYMPPAGEGRLVFEGPGNKTLTFQSVNYGVGTFAAPDCEIVFRNCQPKRGGTPIFRAAGGRITFDGSFNFNQAVMGGCPYFGAGATVTHATNSAPSQIYYFGAYAGEYSYWWFDEGTSLTFSRLYTGVNSVPSVPVIGVRNGGDLTLTDLYISRISGDNIPQFFLEGVESKVTLAEGLYLGTRCPSTSTVKVDSGGAFIQTAGTLTVPKIANELDDNFFYLRGGDLRLGAGGLVVTTSRKDNPVYDKNGNIADSTIYQTTPAFYFQGGTLTATAAFDDFVVTELTTGTRSVLDTAEFEVTVRGDLVGKGALVKRGSGTLVIDGAVKDAAALVIEAGTLALGADFSQEANLAALTVPSAAAVALTAGQNLTVGAFVVDGVAQSGTVACGAGTVTVAGAATDWLTAAQITPNYKKTFGADETLGSFDYENYVSDAGVLTLAGATGVRLTLAAGATISVAAGDTLVFDLPVYLAGGLTVTGGGEVVFTEKAVVTADQDEAGGKKLNRVTDVKGGTWLTVGASWSNNDVIWLVSEATDARLCRLTIEGDGSVNQAPMPLNGTDGSGGKGVGGEMMLVNGGTFRYRATDGIFGTQAVQTQRIILGKGGVLQLPGMLRRLSAASESTLEILDYGGILETETYAVTPVLKREITVELHGEAMEIRPAAKTAPGVNAVEATFTGKGAILLNSSVAPLTLAGDLTGVTNVIVRAGQLILRDRAVDTLGQSDVSLDCAAASLGVGGTATVNGLYLDGAQARQGLYGKGVAPRAKFLAPIESGFLDVRDGVPPGMLIIVR